MRNFFLSRLLREKVLLLAFVAIGAAIWISSASGRTGVFLRQVSMTTTDLETQKQWIDQRERIENDARVAVENLDPVRTFNSSRLQTEIENVARSVKLVGNRDISDPRTERTREFAVHSVQFTVRNSDWEALKTFYYEISKRAPYIGVEQFALQANQSNPAQLTASMRITSVEINR